MYQSNVDGFVEKVINNRKFQYNYLEIHRLI